MDGCLGAILWYFVGFPLAYGADVGHFVGFTWDSLSGCVNYATWMFKWAFSATVATIVSGAVAERCKFEGYLIYTTALTAFIYPVVVHWVWSGAGWLSAKPEGSLPGNGFHDFAGSGVVHMVGGGSALVAAYVIGPRHGRFGPNKGQVNDMPGCSITLAALGTFILWFSWYGFNMVSTLSFSDMYTASRVAVTTTLSAAGGGASALILHVVNKNAPDVAPALNGILAGLVSITASCAVVEPYAAVIIGAIGASVYYYSAMLLRKLRIDDPLEASPVHFFCGMWGVIAVGLFATEEYLGGQSWGSFYGGGVEQLGNQVVGLLGIAAWTFGTSGFMFYTLKRSAILRVNLADEIVGLDEAHYGGRAYHESPEEAAADDARRRAVAMQKNKFCVVDVCPAVAFYSNGDEVTAAGASLATERVSIPPLDEKHRDIQSTSGSRLAWGAEQSSGE
eukprot:CAMPEP_0177760892 /NCGR_PEP_ID=MMETSP0491_2-20121128/5513_1 /TAXON_ID=63592 /ORGANISM="Tetraselmis chuii, Strain PLY429" /LENGTH=448 /DNA_ID=CAMNT_0019276829 /DNA_START=9 /DNA_END=1355 /DNA_ORIENTATION=+